VTTDLPAEQISLIVIALVTFFIIRTETTPATATNCKSLGNVNKLNGKSEEQGAKNGLHISEHIYLSDAILLGFDFFYDATVTQAFRRNVLVPSTG
jgi:hypothetical protein